MTVRSVFIAAAGFLAVSPVVACVGGPQPAAADPAPAIVKADPPPEHAVREAVRKMREEVKVFRLTGEFKALHGDTVVMEKRVIRGIAVLPDFYYEEYSKTLAGGPPKKLFSNGIRNRLQDPLDPKFWLGGESLGYAEGGMALFNPFYTLGVLDRVAGTAVEAVTAKEDRDVRTVRLTPPAKEFTDDLDRTGFHQAKAMDLDSATVEILLAIGKGDGLPRHLKVRARGQTKGPDGQEARATFDATVRVEACNEPVEVEIPTGVRNALGWQKLELPKPPGK